MPVVKHVPGHGRATVDSHLELPRVSANRDELAEDCAPFAALAASGAWAMTAHILYEALDPARPATLSETVIGRVIRHAIGFEGVLVSDDLCMKALRGEPAELAQQAIAAGCDLVLHCNGDPAETASLLAGCPPVSALAEERLHAAKARVRGSVAPARPGGAAGRARRPPARGGRVTPAWLPELVAAVLASVVAITLHEAAHGYAALALGDDTAKRMGRLSLNPLRHVDPVGTVLVPGGAADRPTAHARPGGGHVRLGQAGSGEPARAARPAPGHDAGGRGGAAHQLRAGVDLGAARASGGGPGRTPLARTRWHGSIA